MSFYIVFGTSGLIEALVIPSSQLVAERNVAESLLILI